MVLRRCETLYLQDCQIATALKMSWCQYLHIVCLRNITGRCSIKFSNCERLVASQQKMYLTLSFQSGRRDDRVRNCGFSIAGGLQEPQACLTRNAVTRFIDLVGGVRARPEGLGLVICGG